MGRLSIKLQSNQSNNVRVINFSRKDMSLRPLCAVLRQSQHRQFCLEQRVRFANTYALSKLLYVAKEVAPDKGRLIAMRRHVASLAWEGWRYRVPYPVLCQPLGEGGVGAHDALIRCTALFDSRWLSLYGNAPNSIASHTHC